MDWSGAKLSKSLYVREREYDAMKLLGAEGLCSYARLKGQFSGEGQFSGDGTDGLKRLWEEVQGWVADPRKLFRTFSVEYLTRVILRDRGKWGEEEETRVESEGWYKSNLYFALPIVILLVPHIGNSCRVI